MGIRLVKMASERESKRRKEGDSEDDNDDNVEKGTPCKTRQKEFGEFDT